MKCNLIAAATVLAAIALPAHAANIVDEWASIKAPAAPELKPVTIDLMTTALLMLDFMNQNCGKRPRCLETIPAMKKLLADARAHKVPVVYSIIANSTPADVIKDVAPGADEPHVLSGPDKFLRTDLDKILKDKGITTVIVTGTASNGEWCGVPRDERDCTRGWAVRGRSLRRPRLCFHVHECSAGIGKGNADHDRHDQVLMSLSGRARFCLAPGESCPA